jgi:2,4-dienoyl-CoA reductase (NADPH2)
MTDLGHVFLGGRIGRLAVPHRIVMGAMHLGLEVRDDGGAALAAFYAERARGGAGLMVTDGAEVTRAVRDTAGAGFPIIVRFSGLDLVDGGTEQADVLDFARALASAGADALNVGIGWHESAVPSVQAIVPPGLWVPFAAEAKAAVGDLPVIAGNRVNRAELAESILVSTPIDFISMARPFLADAELIGSARRGRAVNICIGCNQACIDRSLDDREVSCMVNPRAGRELGTRPIRSTAPRHIAVIGGGPAGLQAARQSALAGHRVELYEVADALGGQFRMACKVPGKSDYRDTVTYFAAELTRHRGGGEGI